MRGTFILIAAVMALGVAGEATATMPVAQIAALAIDRYNGETKTAPPFRHLLGASDTGSRAANDCRDAPEPSKLGLLRSNRPAATRNTAQCRKLKA